MTHKPIILKDLSFSLPHKICFDNFSCVINPFARIGIIGNNASGKSNLLKILITNLNLEYPEIKIAHVPQVIEDFESLSGGGSFNKALTQALSTGPDILLLDEPTNHLDLYNRKSLMRMLATFCGTLIIVSHDMELLNNNIDILWHIDNGKVHVFNGSYNDYKAELSNQRNSLQNELEHLHKQKQDVHLKLMHEQNRASKSKAKGQKSIEQRKWPTIVSNAKADRASATGGNKRSAINAKKADITYKLGQIRMPEIIKPKFNLPHAEIAGQSIIAVTSGCAGYGDKDIIKNISLSVSAGDHLAITGNNGSGKSTLIKAIMNDPALVRSGEWYVPKAGDIGYLDPHYKTVAVEKTVIKLVEEVVPEWSHSEIRRHLNDFLFRKNEEVNIQGKSLSGGEKARLALALIAAKTPKLLILDEITNNLDLETKEHIIQILKEYPGTMIVISHDQGFLEEIGIEEFINL
jgi:ATPase subunit of ABC transporter with duplicated ATPase domains